MVFIFCFYIENVSAGNIFESEYKSCLRVGVADTNSSYLSDSELNNPSVTIDDDKLILLPCIGFFFKIFRLNNMLSITMESKDFFLIHK